VGYVVFSGVHSSMVKRGGNVKIEAYKVIAMVFLVEE
jgi:hypothetical protein